MNREQIAKTNLQPYKGLTRAFAMQEMFFDIKEFAEDTIITTKETKSFAGQNIKAGFQPEASFDESVVQVVFIGDGEILAHKVDYKNKKEVAELSAIEGEDEYLVPKGTHFIITDCSNEDDVKEMGYCEVNIEQLSEEEYKTEMSYGAKEIFTI